MNKSWLRKFGSTGLKVSALGFGGGHIGGDGVTDNEATAILNRALDLGINLIDTARSYGRSEERIGRALGARRGDTVLSTKIGYGIAGHADWTAGLVPAAVTEALKKLNTDYIDIVHLHSCPVNVLEQSGVVQALQRETESGRVRVAAYSGDNESLEWAVASGAFDSVQCSINICDQRALAAAIPTAAGRKMGVIAKRPIANGPWKYAARPTGQYVETYWQRFEEMGLSAWPVDWSDAALRFTAHLPGVHSCIVGTRNLAHLERNAEIVRRGPLGAELAERVRATFSSRGASWRSET